jgi:rhodanese-related sulfurtransferase
MAANRISTAELKRRMDAHEPVTIIDTRGGEAWNRSDKQIPGSIRVPLGELDKHLADLPRDRAVVAYCT